MLTPFLAPFPFAYAAARLKDRRLWLFSASYCLASLTLWILWIIAIEKYWTPADIIFYLILLALGLLATIHAFLLRRRVFAPPSLPAASRYRGKGLAREPGRRPRL
jgi:hypothetical protein